MTSPEQQSADLVIHARWVIPVIPANTVLEHHALVINQGQITALVPSAEADELTADNIVRLDTHALTPGLVNAHGHAAMTLFRGMADDKPLHAWLEQDIWPAEGRWVSDSFVHDGAQLAIAEMLLSGTTCFSDMYFFPDAVAKAASRAGIRSQLAFPVLDLPTVWASGPDEYLAKGTALFDVYKNNSLVNIAFGPHAPYTVDSAVLGRIAMLANELDAGIQMHVHETATEIEQYLAQHGLRPLAKLNELGLLGPRMQCVHAAVLDDQDIKLLAETSSHVIHCPESNLKLASGLCPSATLLQAGVNVALGTDGAASNNDLDMFGEMRTAALLAKVIADEASALPAWQALEMATINGARALGLDHTIGSLEAGKSADLVAVDLSDIRLQPIYNPVSQLVYNQAGAHVSDSWVHGRQLVKKGQLTSLDSEQILTNASLWQQRITGSSTT